MAIAIVLVLLVLGSILFHFLSPWQPTPLASNWGQIDDTIVITLIITGLVFIAVTLFMAYAVLRFRHREGNRATYEPENKRLELWLMILTTLGIVGMLAPGLFVYAKFVSVPQDAAEVEVLGQQWQWSFRLPGQDQVLGTTDIAHMAPDNPFGLNPNDPNGQDDVLIQGAPLHLPVDKPVKFLLRSKDVLHDFYVPQFRAKMDLVPGQISHFWLTPTRTGSFEILCAELCGVGHFNMRGRLVVENDADFQTWLSAQATFAQPSALSEPSLVEGGDLTAMGEQLASSRGCLACHSLDGGASVGPTWKGLVGKTDTLADGSRVTVDDDYLRESILAPNAKVVQGYPPIMPPASLSDQELDALIAFIKSVSGD